MMRDNDFGNIRLRGYGIYSFKIDDAKLFMKEMFGTNQTYTVADTAEYLKPLIVQGVTDAIAESKISALDLAANYKEFGEKIVECAQEEFNKIGLKITNCVIENLSLPEEVEKALDERPTPRPAIFPPDVFFAASSISFSFVIFFPDKTSASGIFGVITVAKGRSSFWRVSMAWSLMSFAPLVATITGSTTRFFKPYSLIESEITLIIGVDETIPVFTASGKISVTTALISSLRNSGSTSIIAVTPVVFCAVKAVIALMA